MEEHIRDLAATNLDTLRLLVDEIIEIYMPLFMFIWSNCICMLSPVGDWMFVPYGPYIGCMDGAMDELNRVIALAKKYKLKVLLDMHAM